MGAARFYVMSQNICPAPDSALASLPPALWSPCRRGAVFFCLCPYGSSFFPRCVSIDFCILPYSADIVNFKGNGSRNRKEEAAGPLLSVPVYFRISFFLASNSSCVIAPESSSALSFTILSTADSLDTWHFAKLALWRSLLPFSFIKLEPPSSLTARPHRPDGRSQ